MDEFGPKHEVHQSTKAKCGRPKKKPGYDKTEMIDELLSRAVELFEIPYDDRVVRDADAPTLISVANTLQVTLLKARKLLITAGYYSTELSRRVQKLYNEGNTIQEIMKILGLGRASVHSYLPYKEGAYNLDVPSLYSEQSKRYRQRKQACAELSDHMDDVNAEYYLWKAVEAFQDFPFHTEQGKLVKYTVENEMVCFNRRDERISKEGVESVFRKIREMQKNAGFVTLNNGFYKTGVNEYLLIVFLRLGVCTEPNMV